jgi:hypothetical protein
MQNIDGNPAIHDENNYTLKDSITETALSGTNVSPQLHTYTGFRAPGRQGAVVNGDGTTVINYYYERQTYTFDINTQIGGADYNHATSACTFTIVLNGEIVATDVGDFCKSLPYGTEYEVIVYAQDGYDWSGGLVGGSAPLKGTVDAYTMIRIPLIAEPC